MIKKLLNKYFVMIGLIVTGAIVIAWNLLLIIHPFITIIVLLAITGTIMLKQKLKGRKVP